MNITKEEVKQILDTPFYERKDTQKNLWVLRCYGDGRSYGLWMLTYSSQLKFKDVAQRYFGLKKGLYYFDDVSCVDAKTGQNIPGVNCAGSLRWGEAIDKLKAYFNINN